MIYFLWKKFPFFLPWEIWISFFEWQQPWRLPWRLPVSLELHQAWREKWSDSFFREIHNSYEVLYVCYVIRRLVGFASSSPAMISLLHSKPSEIYYISKTHFESRCLLHRLRIWRWRKPPFCVCFSRHGFIFLRACIAVSRKKKEGERENIPVGALRTKKEISAAFWFVDCWPPPSLFLAEISWMSWGGMDLYNLVEGGKKRSEDRINIPLFFNLHQFPVKKYKLLHTCIYHMKKTSKEWKKIPNLNIPATNSMAMWEWLNCRNNYFMKLYRRFFRVGIGDRNAFFLRSYETHTQMHQGENSPNRAHSSYL